jgi:putative DNA primase/helicase
VTCAWGCTSFAPDDEDCRRYGLGAMALRYSWLGYSVLPLQSGGKRPHPVLGHHGGVHKASRDPAQLRSWWSSYPAANVGVACGSASRLAVVDLDVKHGVNGGESFQKFLWDWRLEWPDKWHSSSIPMVTTPSGGAHLYLRVPEGARVPDRPGILPGVDVKGDGGYV